MAEHQVQATVNGREVTAMVEPRLTLADFLRDKLRLTGTHLGCEHGVCGACTVLVDGAAIRSCLAFAIQMQGCSITTVEGLTPDSGELTDVQAAFRAEHGLQCGFCTPGFVVSATALLAERPDLTAAEVREGLSGNLCRCTGYQGIVRAVQSVIRSRQAARSGPEAAGAAQEAEAGATQEAEAGATQEAEAGATQEAGVARPAGVSGS
jgi:aerobic carbon-monoxide dehydrogenase small subunit